MKQFYLLSTLLYALAISNPVSAQITIDEIKTDPSERILKNEVRPTTVDAQSYFSCARYRAERAAIRKERNTLEFGGGILGSVVHFSFSLGIAKFNGKNTDAFLSAMDDSMYETKNMHRLMQ